MKSKYKRLGELIEEVDTRNESGANLPLLGLSINKCFIPSVANVIGTDLSKYKLIKKREFAVSLMQVSRDEKIPIACLQEHSLGIMSPAYKIFRVGNTDELLPEYMALWFKRPEFDREATFIAVGGVRGSMPWEDFCRMNVYIPSIDRQRQIVHAYNVISERIQLKERINNNLSAILDTFFCNLYEHLNDDNLTPLNMICSLASSKRVFADDYSDSGVPFYRGKEITLKQAGQPIIEPLYIKNEHFVSLKKKYGIPQKGDILITAVGTIGNSYLVGDEEFYFKDGNIIWLKNFKKRLNYYIYDFMQSKFFKQILEGICIGSTQTALTIVALSNIQIKIPNDNLLVEYTKPSVVLRSKIKRNTDEIAHLYELRSAILTQLSR